LAQWLRCLPYTQKIASSILALDTFLPISVSFANVQPSVIMGKKRSNSSPGSMLTIKPPIHRIASNSIAKNVPIKKDLFNVSVPVAAARLKPNLIGEFLKKYQRYRFLCFSLIVVIYGLLEELNESLKMETRSYSFWIQKYSQRVTPIYLLSHSRYG
jgi:hypothetical protein